MCLCGANVQRAHRVLNVKQGVQYTYVISDGRRGGGGVPISQRRHIIFSSMITDSGGANDDQNTQLLTKNRKMFRGGVLMEDIHQWFITRIRAVDCADQSPASGDGL